MKIRRQDERKYKVSELNKQNVNSLKFLGLDYRDSLIIPLCLVVLEIMIIISHRIEYKRMFYITN